MSIARIQNDAIAEQRSDITLDDVPAHKRNQWRLIVGDPPAFDAATQYLTGPVYVIGATEVTRQWTVNNRTITPDDVATERTRRLELGFDYDFGDARGVHHIGTTAADLIGWDEVTKYANALIDSGDTTTTIAIVTDTAPCLVTAPEWQAVMLAAAETRQPLWAASFVLQSMSPIPASYRDDQNWT